MSRIMASVNARETRSATLWETRSATLWETRSATLWDVCSMMPRWAAQMSAFTMAAMLVSCGPAPLPPAPPAAVEPSPLTEVAASQASGEPTQEDLQKKAFTEMLERVSKARGLAVVGEVKLVTLSRDQIGALIRKKAETELPADVLAHETEALFALGLIAPSYDAVTGMFALINTSISGFYEPADKTMYLASDLKPGERDETLAHELVHALQDQHYDLGARLKYAPDNGERVAAEHAVAEGDATSAMFDVAQGDSMKIAEDRFAAVARDSIASLAPDVPLVLRESLLVPYMDGFSFVQALRRRGGFHAVDAAWRKMPETTEQLLHLDKYDANEAAIEIAPVGLDPLTRGKRSFKQVHTQTVGEQALRIVLSAWVNREQANVAAAGWGGDRYVLAEGQGEAAGETALGWLLRFDTEKDANEMAKVLSAEAHGQCVARPDVGPFAWAQKKRNVALAMGPYSRHSEKAVSTGNCKEAKSWLTSMLASAKSQ